MKAVRVLRALVPVLALVLPACGSKFEGGGDLRARKVVLKREVEGLREAVARLEKGQPILPARRRRRRDRRHPPPRPDHRPAPVRDGRGPLPPQPHGGGGAVPRQPDRPAARGAQLEERPDLVAAVNVIGALEGIQVENVLVHPAGENRGGPHRHREGGGPRAGPERIDDGRGGAPRPPPARGPAAPGPDPGEGAAEHRLPGRHLGPGSDRRGEDAPRRRRCPRCSPGRGGSGSPCTSSPATS